MVGRPCIATALASALIAGLATDAAACACCVSAGARHEGVHALDGYLKGEMARVVFADYAWLHTTEAFPDDIKGLAAPQTQRYRATWTRTATGWTLALEAKSGAKGTLVLTMPKRIERRESHMPKRPGPEGVTAEDDRPYDEQRDVTLYKEWHLVAPVRGDGMFSGAMRGAPSARLILQGQGNGCAMAEDLYFWTLVVSGPSARFTLLGRIIDPASGVRK